MTIHEKFDHNLDDLEQILRPRRRRKLGPLGEFFAHLGFHDTDTLNRSEPLARNIAISIGLAVVTVAAFNGLVVGFALTILMPDQKMVGIISGVIVGIMILTIDRFFLGSNQIADDAGDDEDDFIGRYWRRGLSLLTRIVLSVFIAIFAAQMFVLSLFREDALKAVEVDAAQKNAALYAVADREWANIEEQRALLTERLTQEQVAATALRSAMATQQEQLSVLAAQRSQAQAVAAAEEMGTTGSGLQIFDGVELSGVETCGANCETALGVAAALSTELTAGYTAREDMQTQLNAALARADGYQVEMDNLPTEAEVRAKVPLMEDFYEPGTGVLSVIMGLGLLKNDPEYGEVVRNEEFKVHGFLIALDLAVLLGAGFFGARTSYQILRKAEMTEVYEMHKQRILNAKNGPPNATMASIFESDKST